MPARAFAIPLAAAVIGGGVTAGVLVGAGAVGQRTTTTIVQQAPLTSASPASESRAGGLTARDIYRRAAPGVVFIRARSVQQTQSPFDVFPRTQENRRRPARASCSTTRATSSPTRTWSAASLDVRVSFSDHRTVSARVVGKDADTDLAVLAGQPQGGSTCTRSSSATPAPCGSATRRWRSATRSASSARSPPASCRRCSAASRRPAASRSRTSSRPTRRSTPATPAARCSTPPAA